jgi:hypothetical protein
MTSTKEFMVKAPGFTWHHISEKYYRVLIEIVESRPEEFEGFKFAEVDQLLN